MKLHLDKSVLKRIRAALRQQDPAARADAVEVLAAIGDARGLTRALASDDAYLRSVAVRGLAREPAERVAWRLAQRIFDDDELVRRHVAFALGQRGEWIAGHALKRLVERDGAMAVRCEALAAYAETSRADVEPVLRAAADGDDDPEVRELARDLHARLSPLGQRATGLTTGWRSSPSDVRSLKHPGERRQLHRQGDRRPQAHSRGD